MIKKLLLGNKRLQRFWWFIFRLSVKGLNYDRGHIPSANGERFALGFVLRHLKSVALPVIFDVGANRGQYLQMAKESSKREFQIYCFEPQSSAVQSLNDIAAKYKHVVVEHIGMSDRPGKSVIYRDSESSEYASLYESDYSQYKVKLSFQEEIKLTTIDEYCNANGIDEIHFLKLDVEGHEISVLKGAKWMISAARINFIQFELGLASIESRVFLKDFFRVLNDYSIYRILPNGLDKINYSEYSELFLTTNYLAVHNNQQIK